MNTIDNDLSRHTASVDPRAPLDDADVEAGDLDRTREELGDNFKGAKIKAFRAVLIGILVLCFLYYVIVRGIYSLYSDQV